MTARRTGSRRALPALGLAVLLAVAGCSGGQGAEDGGRTGTDHPVVTPRQAVQILGTVDAALVRGVTSRDVNQLAGRVVGPEKEELTASFVVLTRLKQAGVAPPAPSRPRLLLPQAGPWPRWFMAAGSSPTSPTPILRVLLSAGPRAPYGLWSQLSLLPGTTMPDIASATVGAAGLAPTATGLVSPPATVLADYADLLNRGDLSSHRAQFEVDDFRTQLNQQLKNDRAAFSAKSVGEVLAQHTVAPGPVFALGTRDGGALVIGRIDQKYSVRVAKGKGSVKLDTQLAALAGAATVTTRLDRTSIQTVAFYVPRAGSSAKVTVIAASKADVAASGS